MYAWQFAKYQYTARANGWTEFISMQNQISLPYQEELREMVPFCQDSGVGVIPWYACQSGSRVLTEIDLRFALHAGKLTRPWSQQSDTIRAQSLKYNATFQSGQHSEETIKRVEEVAKKRGLSMAAIAFMWTASKCTAPLIGISKIERIQDFAEVIDNDLELTVEEAKYLEEP